MCVWGRRGGAGFATKLSSAGLVYKHFGRAIIAGLLEQPEGAPDTETVYVAVYKNFMEAIDGIDNGVFFMARLRRDFNYVGPLSFVSLSAAKGQCGAARSPTPPARS